MAIKVIKKQIEAEILVESESVEGAYYMCILNEYGWGCTCPHFQNRKQECKHISQAKQVIQYD